MVKASIRELELIITVEDLKGYLNSRGLETLTKWLEQVSPEKDKDNVVMDRLCGLLLYFHQHIKTEDKIHTFLGLNSTLRLHAIDISYDFCHVNLCFTLDTVNVALEDVITAKGGGLIPLPKPPKLPEAAQAVLNQTKLGQGGKK